jgi:hypothetical protein
MGYIKEPIEKIMQKIRTHAKKKHEEQTAQKAGSVDISNIDPEVIQAVHGLSKGKIVEPDADYLGLIAEYRKQNPDATALQAIKAVNHICPQARENLIESQRQAAAEPEPEQKKYSAEEIAGYLVTVTRYQIDKGCTRLQAVKDMDTLKPGLREAYVRFVNKYRCNPQTEKNRSAK